MSGLVHTSVLTLSFLILTACTNNININGSLSSVNGSTPVGSTNGTSTNNGAFTLSRVVMNATNPASVLDLIDDGSGVLGQICAPTSAGATGSTTPVSCNCTYSYTVNGVTTQQDQAVFYHENDLVRCLYGSGITPTSLTTMQVSVHNTSADTYSTKVTFNLTNTGISIDTTNPTSFIQPIRYQCRQSVTVLNLLDSNIYDPFQSEDPDFTYPLDFYATNIGGAIANYVSADSGGTSSTNCPPIFQPSLSLTSAAAISSYNATYGVNMNVYSRSPLNGSKSIYPVTPGGFDRSTFYLLKQASGVFTVQVDAQQSPLVNTGTTLANGTVVPSLGYGASPIPVGVGTGQETCPDTSVPIPPNFHWAKLWLFRASLPQRHYLTSGSTPSIGNINQIICNPGDVSDGASPANYKAAFPVSGCYREYSSIQASHTSDSFNSISMNEVAGGTKAVTSTNVVLADRILNVSSSTSGTASNICVRLQKNYAGTANSASSLGSCNTTPPTPGPACDITNFPNGADFWQAEAPYFTNSDIIAYQGYNNSGCGANPNSPVFDPVNACYTANPLSAGVPYTYNVSTGNYDSAGISRFDFLFVVTPTSISTVDMQDGTSSSTSYSYQPYRYMASSDCQSADPDNPLNSTDCLASKQLTYGVKLHGVNDASDPDSTSTARAGVFPVCVLQPN